MKRAVRNIEADRQETWYEFEARIGQERKLGKGAKKSGKTPTKLLDIYACNECRAQQVDV